MNTNSHKNSLLYPELSYTIQGCVFEIRRQYGPGQKEVVYNRLLEEKLINKGLIVEKEKRINIFSQDSGKIVGTYQPDLVIDNKILIELKSSLFTTRTDEKQLYHYLRNSEFELGYLINFSTPKLYIKVLVNMVDNF